MHDLYLIEDNEPEYKPPRAPKGLGAAGRKLWRDLTADIAFEPHELRLLADACKVADLIAKLDQAAEDSPLVVKGSTGQPVINPVIAEARVQRGLLAKLLKDLRIPATEEAEQEAAQSRSEKARKAAKARWGER